MTELCDLTLQHKLVDVFYTTWRKAIRRLFGLPRNAHCNMLPLVAACLPISRVAQGAYLEVEYIRNVLIVSGTLKYADSGTA